MTWTSGSLTCVSDLFTSVYTLGTLVYSFIQKIFIETADKFIMDNSWGRCKAWQLTVIHCQNTTSVDIKQIKCYKRIQSLIHNHMQQKHSDFSRPENITISNNPALHNQSHWHQRQASHSEKNSLWNFSHMYNSITAVSLYQQVFLWNIKFSYQK